MKKNNILISIMALLFIISIVGCKEDKATPRKGQSDAVFNPNLEYGTVTDIDGNTYKTIKIGTQTWMAQNLRVTHYQNGDPIPFDTINNWLKLETGVYAIPYSSNVDTIATYGLLYNGYAATDPRNIAPKGWRVPSIEDVSILHAYLEAQETPEDNIRAGGRLKEAGTKHWLAPNVANNSSGFTLLPNPQYFFNKIGKTKSHGELFTASRRISPTGFDGDLYIYGSSFDTDLRISESSALRICRGLGIRCIKNN